MYYYCTLVINLNYGTRNTTTSQSRETLGETLNSMILRNSRFILILVLFTRCNQAINSDAQKTMDSSSVPIKPDSQYDINLQLSEKIRSSDTILLVSHSGNTFDTVKGEIFPALLVNNKINQKIIHELKTLTNNSIDTLVKILSMPTNEADYEMSHCCDPHHTIFIIKDGQISYIDLCFHCFCLSTSKDLELIKGYDEPKWIALLSFFRKLSFKYEMPEK